MTPPPKVPRAVTNTDRDRRQTPTSGVPASVMIEDPTPPPQQMPILPRTSTNERLDMIEQQARALTAGMADVWEARHNKERFDKIDYALERLDTRMDGYAERVVRAEHAGAGAWDAVKALGPKLDEIHKGLGDTGRLADGVERLINRVDEQSNRIAAVETKQKIGASQLKTQEKSLGDMTLRQRHDSNRLTTVEQKQALAENTTLVTEKVSKEVTERTAKSAARRAWWFSSKGIATVVTAITGGIVAIIAAAMS